MTNVLRGGAARQGRPRRKGESLSWLEERWADKLAAMRGKGESYSVVIIRLAGLASQT
jgi:hypothetical protein